jgi:hypothetical protein
MAVQSPPASVTKSTVTNTTGVTPARPSATVVDGKTTTTEKNLNKPDSKEYEINPFPNPLEEYASYSPVWTLACLEPKQFNDPRSYRQDGQLKHIVMSSAGRFDAERVNTAYGKPEFYINNFTMKTVIAANQRTGNSNAIKFEWEIYEPYSMGLLLQSLQVAAKNAGYLNYLDNAPYVLRLDFMGFGELQERIQSVTPKFFTLRLTSVKFSVTESGSTYKMEAIPYNHQGFSDDINTSYNDLKLTANSGSVGTVQELLSTGANSLQAALNQIEKKLVDEKQIQFPDQYEIVFPEKSSDFVRIADGQLTEKRAVQDPSNVNEIGGNKVISGTAIQVQTDFSSNNIGKSEFGFDQSRPGNFPFRKAGDQVDEKTGLVKRDNMTIDPKNRSFQFTQGQSITAMINQIILSSNYAKEALVPQKDGFVRWWRIDVQIELKEYDEWIGDFAKKFTFRVVPFLVHHTIFSNPQASPIGYPELAKKIVKKYQYIYSGQNVDILKFDININNLFYTGTNPSAESDTAGSAAVDDSGTAAKTVKKTEAGKGSSPTAPAANLGRRRRKRDPDLLKKNTTGGDGAIDTERKVAEAFHQAFLSGSSADLVKINLEVLGDPYWIVDSGMGNYFSEAENDDPTSQRTKDGSMNYESGDVFVYISLRTPADVDEIGGLYQFSSVMGKESPFSGIYRVIMCSNEFSEGMFRQKLECIRMPGQATEFKDLPAAAKPKEQTPPEEAVAVKVGEPDTPRGTVADTNVGIKIYNEDGSVSNFRRNPETGELYDASGLQRAGA